MSDAGAEPRSSPAAPGVSGRVLCARLAAEGWRVIAVDRDAGALAALPDGVERREVDISDEAAVAACFDVLASTG